MTGVAGALGDFADGMGAFERSWFTLPGDD
jgi:hypothetical protein